MKRISIRRLSLQLTIGVVLLTGATHVQGLAPLQPGAANGCAAKVAVFPAAGTAPSSIVDYSLWRTMTQAWNAQRPNQQKIIRDRVASFPLHDVSVTLPPAPFNPTILHVCSFSSNPATKTFQLNYRARGNSFSARHDKPYWRDPKVSGTFDLDVVMSFTTGGFGGQPVVLQSSQVRVRNFVYTGSLDVEAQSDGTTFSQQAFADAGVGAFVAVDANRFFRLLLANQAIGGVAPGRRPEGFAFRAFFDVRAARPSIGVGILN